MHKSKNLLRVSDYVRKTRKGLVPSKPFDKRTFGVVVKTTSTKAYIIPVNTFPISVKFKKNKVMAVKVSLKNMQIFPMPKQINKFQYMEKNS